MPALAGEGGDDARIRPSGEHPRYWQYKGNPVLLLGGSDEDNLFNKPLLMRENLDALAGCGGNYIRGTLSWRDEGNVPPFADRDGRFDLNAFNPEFWNRLDTCLREAAKRDIIVQIEVWATFDYYRDLWKRNPFNPARNVNYTTKNTKLKREWNFHPAHRPQPFVHSVPGLNNDREVLKYQQAFVRKVLDVSLPYPNVLYCLDNETKAPKQWPLYWAGFLTKEAKTRGKTVQVTEMFDPWNISDARHDITFGNPGVFTFADISQNNHKKGQAHYDNALKRWLSIKDRPWPLNNVKIYGADGGRFGNSRDAVERFWRNVFGGHASSRFHRPDSGLGLGERARRMIRSAREVTDAFDVFESTPRNELLARREDNEAYCLAAPGGTYAVYFPRDGEVTLNTAESTRSLTLRWYDIDRGKWQDEKSVASTAPLVLKTPGPGQWAAVIR